ncbi:hypothetical protein ebA2441 [Aromatoleum aromaticum EbN1]|uniref:Uncharacterized protein n=1 Tax=Aromatoleum aromaticum (strain DSM 19018 / LMG 30748 / EbN1) TaxID=76114 RepID=Q5P5B5_AROAE|nr:hypothetical protein ebA2441 [Aromatoleum aromaticum EbN1]
MALTRADIGIRQCPHWWNFSDEASLTRRGVNRCLLGARLEAVVPAASG